MSGERKPRNFTITPMPNEERAFKRKRYRENQSLSKENRQLSWGLWSKYKITVGDYNKLFQKQNGCCAICNRHQAELKRRLDVDHNHTTGKIRGLLCNRCNLSVGYIEADNFPKAFEYVCLHNKQEVLE